MTPSHFPLPCRSHPLILLPLMQGLEARWNLATGLSGHTLKRRSARLAACLLAPLLGPRTPLAPLLIPLPSRARALLDQLAAEDVLPEMRETVVLMSPVAGRRRIYLHHLDAAGRIIAYSKIGFGTEDLECLSREVVALNLFAESPTFTVPRLLAMGESPEIGAYIVTAALEPSFSRTIARSGSILQALMEALPGPVQLCQRQDLIKRWWYRQGMVRLNGPTRDHLASLAAKASPLAVCRAHGDVGGENLYVTPDGRLALIDWESFDFQAPVLTDAVSYWIGLHHAELRAQQSSVIAEFLNNFAHHSDELAFALLFLVGTDIHEARLLLAALFAQNDKTA